MSERIYLDTDIILDLLAERIPFHADAARLFSLIEAGEIQGCVSPLIYANLYYLLKMKTGPEARSILARLKLLLKVLSIDENIIELALHSKFHGFEDAVQYHTAVANGIPFLITRNKADYKGAKITVCGAGEYLEIRAAAEKARPRTTT